MNESKDQPSNDAIQLMLHRAGCRELLSAFLENLPTPMWVKDLQGRYLLLNSPAAQLVGRQAVEVLGRTDNDLWPHALAQGFIQNDQEVVQGGKPIHKLDIVEMKDGRHEVLVSKFPIRNSEGQVALIGGVGLNVTQLRRTEKALQETETTARTLLNATSEIIYLIDLQGNVLFANKAGAQRLNESQDSILGKNIFALLPPALAASRRAHGEEMLRTGRPVQFEDVRNDRIIENNIYPLFDGQGNVVKVAIFSNDITDRRRAEEEARTNRKLLAEAERLSQTGAVEWDLATNRVFCSDGWLAIHGCTRKVMTTEEMLLLAHPEDRAAIVQMLREVRQGLRTYNMEHRIVRQDTGEERHMRAFGALVRDKQGQPVKVLGVAQDVTEQKRAQEALQVSEQRARALLNAITESILLMDVEGRILAVNATMARRLGYPIGDLIGKRAFSFLPPDSGRAREARAREAIRTGLPIRFEDERNGTQFDNSMYPVCDGAGKVTGLAIFGRDITERKAAEEKLAIYARQLQELSQELVEAQEKERRRLARELHDQIGQDLTGIQINLQTVLREPASSPLANRLQETLRLVSEVIRKTQDLSFNLRPALLDDLGLEATLRWYAQEICGRSGIQVEFWASPMPKRLHSQIETACFRIAQEALTNILRHARAQGVTVNLRCEEEWVHLVIHDDGVGFDAETVLSKADRRDSLGLLGMQERASLVGGRLECKSSPTEGTQIHGWFPLLWRD